LHEIKARSGTIEEQYENRKVLCFYKKIRESYTRIVQKTVQMV